MLAIEIRDLKPAKKHVSLLFLHVHKDNVAAQKFTSGSTLYGYPSLRKITCI